MVGAMYSCMTLASAAAGVPAERGRLLQGLQILERDGAALQQIGHQQARRAAEQVEQIAYQADLVVTLVDGRREELRVADLLDLAQRPLLLQAVDQRLDGRV